MKAYFLTIFHILPFRVFDDVINLLKEMYESAGTFKILNFISHVQCKDLDLSQREKIVSHKLFSVFSYIITSSKKGGSENSGWQVFSRGPTWFFMQSTQIDTFKKKYLYVHFLSNIFCCLLPDYLSCFVDISFTKC